MSIIDIGMLVLNLTAIVAFLSLSKFRKFPIVLFPIFLLLNAVLEDAFFFRHKFEFLQVLNGNNLLLYNLKDVLLFAVIFVIMLYHVQFKLSKNWIRFGGIVAFVALVVNLFVQDPTQTKLDYFIFFSHILVLIFFFVFFMEVFTLSRLKHYKRRLVFYFALGYTIYFALFLPLKITQKLLPENLYNSHYLLLAISISIVYLGLFIFGFLWSKPEK